MSGGWRIEKRPNRPGRQRPFIWWVTCPTPPDEPDWDNDFRPAPCGCRRFPTQGKAERYVERMTSNTTT